MDFAESQFQLADLNGDGWVSLDEFTNYFYAELKLLDGSLFMGRSRLAVFLNLPCCELV